MIANESTKGISQVRAKVNCRASPGSSGSFNSWHTAAPSVAPFTLPSSLVVAALPVAAAAASASDVPVKKMRSGYISMNFAKENEEVSDEEKIRIRQRLFTRHHFCCFFSTK